MSRIIKRYRLEPQGRQEIMVGGSPTALSVGSGDQVPCIWVEVDDNEPFGVLKIDIVATGEVLPDYVRAENFVGTIESPDHSMSAHVFAVKA